MPRGGRRILFAGGGTGGHIFPGLALAQRSSAALFWLCTTRPFDSAQLSAAGVPFETLPSPRWSGVRGFLAPMAGALMASSRRIRAFRPDVVLGLGGYGSVPPVLAAVAAGIPYAILELNARPGRANRFLAAGAARIYAQWPQARGGLRVVVTGSPLRARLRRVPREEALRRFGLEPGRPTLAVIGGSQGAEALNRGAVAGLDGTASQIQVIHVAGAGRAEGVREAYRAAGARASVWEFLPDMETLYSAADLAVSRAGAMAIAELAAFGLPAVLVPIARSADGHQLENARVVARAGAALLLEEGACLAGGLAPILRRLAAEPGAFAEMRTNLGEVARPEAAQAILDDLEALLP